MQTTLQKPKGEPEGEQTSTGSQVPDTAKRLAWRWRKQAMPLAGIGATHGIGAATAALSGATALVPAAAGVAATAGAYGYAHRYAGRWDRIYAGVAAVGSAAFQLSIGLAGPDGVIASLLWAGGCALSVPWWVRHAEPEPDVTAELAAPAPPRSALPVAPGVADRRMKLWDEHMAGKEKPLPGSTLGDITAINYGWKATVELPTGQHWTKVMDGRRAILSVYDLPDGRVFVEAIPGESVRKARITVLTSDPLQAVNRWKGPGLDPSTGSFPTMVTADGEVLPFRFWWPGGGATHGLVSGVNGSGKTKVLDLVLTEASASDRVVPLVIDGGGGASLPQWKDHAQLFAETPGDARKVLRYALRLMDQRRKTLKRRRGGSLEPSPDLPLVLIVIDEAHKLLMNDEDEDVDNSDVRRMCEKLTQEGRKYLMGLVLSTQVPSAKQLGNSTVLRDQLKAGTVIGLRVTERTSGNMITSGAPMPEGLHELPAEFPDGSPTRGLGYVLTSRMIRARSLLIDGPDEQPVGSFTSTSLDTDCAAEPPPTLSGDDDSEAETGEPGGKSDEVNDRVWQALSDGADPSDIHGLMRDTGCTLGEIRRAVSKWKTA